MIQSERRTSNIEHPTPNRNTRSEIRNSKSRRLGQYFTPEPIVELCYRMLRTLDPDSANPSIIDPACGEGTFLFYALEHDITTPDRLFGVEKDALIAQAIPSGHTNLFVGDGLGSPASWTPVHSHTPTLPHSHTPFDWVVGNPPFGTGGLESADLALIGSVYTIWRGKGRRNLDLSRYRIEILFLERFVQLAKPGGHIAIIVPDGILANERLSYVREWLWEHAEVKAVISLPQHTFHRHGASAKASVLVLRRRENGRMGEWANGRVGVWEYRDSLRPFSHSPILPSSTGDRLDPAYYHPRFTENLRFLESLPNAVRLGDLIEFTTYGQVGSREYSESGVRLLTPASLAVTEDGYVIGVDIRNPERFVPEGSRNDPPRSRLRRGDLLLANSGVGCIGRPAVFYSDEPCNISQHLNVIRFGVRERTIWMLNQVQHDVGPIRHAELDSASRTPLPHSRPGVIESEYVAVYLQTRFGRLQIHRQKCGVGACGINFNRIRSILMPVLSQDERRGIVDGYQRRGIRQAVGQLEESILRGSK